MNSELFFVISLEWYSAFYIGIRGNFLVVTGATLPNRQSIRLEQAQPFRTDKSARRIDTSIWPKRVVPEQTHPFGQNGRTILNRHVYLPNRHIYSHTTFNVRLKSFTLFVPFSSCSKPTSDLNISFIRKWNWICECTMFIANGKRTHFNHLPRILNSGSCLKSSSNFPKNSLG